MAGSSYKARYTDGTWLHGLGTHVPTLAARCSVQHAACGVRRAASCPLCVGAHACVCLRWAGERRHGRRSSAPKNRASNADAAVGRLPVWPRANPVPRPLLALERVASRRHRGNGMQWLPEENPLKWARSKLRCIALFSSSARRRLARLVFCPLPLTVSLNCP